MDCPGQGDAGEGAEKNGQHDSWTERELRGQAERVGDDNATEKEGERGYDPDLENPHWQGQGGPRHLVQTPGRPG